MASLLNNASLLLNPAGSIIAYEEDKIFSVLPSNGTGDFTFSGGDGGTRVNQQGYVVPTPSNLLNNTNTFSSWNLEGGTLTGGFPDPEGGNTAYKYTAIGGNGLWSSTVAFGVAVGYGSGYPLPGSITFSFWIKSVTGNNMTANISDGVSTSGGTVNITGTWQYITRTITPLGPWGGFYLSGLSDAANGYYIWHPQINIGSTALPYQPTTDRLNYPRITYQNGRGALMGELQRTNYALYSNSCAWTTQVGASLTFSSSISPDGTQNATTLNVGTGAFSGTYYGVFRGTEVPVVSIFAKAGTLPFLYFVNPAGSVVVAYYNLRNGTVSNVTAGYNAYMEPYKDGWYRCVLGCPSQTNSYIQIGATDVSGVGAASYAGNIYIWGGQNEVGTFNINYATSYIPTTTATVTRPSDIPYASGVSSLVGQSSGGTLYVSGVPRASEQEFAAITPGGYTTVDGVYINYNNGSNLNLFVVGGSTTQILSATTINVGQYFKAAARYGNGSTAYYVNGKQIATTSAALAFTNTLNRIDLRGNAYYYSTPGAQEISTVATYTSGLTNTQLAELTTVRSGSGGNISYYGPYTIHTFTGSATFTPSFTGSVEVLVVAGGGGGGNNHAGGGGAGGLIYASSYGVSAGTGITVTVGAGGTSPVSNPDPVTNGSNSVFGGLTAIGGGGGGNRNDFNNNSPGGNGGSGGGGGGSQTFYPGNWVPGNGVLGQGNNGGAGIDIYGGGGGGAGAAGTIGAASSAGGNGGNGLPYSISGFSTYYAGGGGGGYCPIAGGGNGGLGGGGKGGILITDKGTPGVPYTGAGGGGGGAGGTQGSIGGAGIVIVRYLT
jgi:hypothetical protein